MNGWIILAFVLGIGLWLWFIMWLSDFEESDFEDDDLEELWDKNT